MPETTTAPVTPASITEIRCPHCGHDGKTKKSVRDKKLRNDIAAGVGFRYLEDIVAHRNVSGIRVDDEGKPTLWINSFYETGEGYDDGSNPRLECRACYGEFPIPDGLEYDWE